MFWITARSISKKLSINVSAMAEGTHSELWRGIRHQITGLLDGLDPKDLATMSLGLSHSLSRFVLSISSSALSDFCFASQVQAEIFT